MFRFVLLLLFSLSVFQLTAQPERWQQRIEYEMEIDFDVETHRYDGVQRMIYFNNSPDSLHQVFFHLYLNAFQPGSMMDVRSQVIPDPDVRMKGRIQKLKPDEIGYQKVKSLTFNGKAVEFETVGTVLEVRLPEPIAPESQVSFEMTYEAQVPLQVRRSGRDNKEGIDYSMAQWYPKMAEYDYQGWHANPYIAREFYGVWGDFDVKISIDRDYILGGTGYLQNPQEIGYGYEKEGQSVERPAGEKLTWHFFAPDVHDFVWAADPDYQHLSYERKDGVVLHFLFQPGERTTENWRMFPPAMDKALDYINEHFGPYPYKQYSFIQAGDGGMEYPMATLITGKRIFPSLVGVGVHELMHSWYQMIMGTNESLYAWMDEGFTTYGSARTMNYLRKNGYIPGSKPVDNPFKGIYAGYISLALSGLEEPMTTHADHYVTNFAYGRASYDKGGVFLHQLEYIIGKQAFAQGMLDYCETWKFKHPNANDFVRVMEKASGIELDWYREYFVQSTHQIDYAIGEVEVSEAGKTRIELQRLGRMPMPVDLVVTTNKGETYTYVIPLRIMRGAKKDVWGAQQVQVATDWPWTHPIYTLEIPVLTETIEKIEIDPSMRMADVDRENNVYEQGDR